MYQDVQIIYFPGLFRSGLIKGDDFIWPNDDLSVAIMAYVSKASQKFLGALFKKHNKPPAFTNSVLADFADNITDTNLVPATYPKKNHLIALLKKKTNNNLHIFNYDWRLSLDAATDAFSREFENLNIGDKKCIFIGHSAGGLIAYKYLNSQKYKNDVNFSKVTKAIMIGCPIQGSIRTLVSILGFEKSSVLTSEEIQEIVSHDIFKSVYELIPYALSLYFTPKGRKMGVEEIFEILREKVINKENLESGFLFRRDFTALKHNPDVDFLFIVGHTKGPMCIGFEITKDKTLVPIYDYAAGDGSVLASEAVPDSRKVFRTRHVYGKHSYLTEIDDVLDIIETELDESNFLRGVIIAKNITYKDKIYKFNMYYINPNDSGNMVQIKDYRAGIATFTNKTSCVDLTKTLKNSDGVFSFKSSHEFGTLKFRDLEIFQTEGEIIHVKNIHIEIEKPKVDFF
ncbi:putative lecithin:cholesterol acyltransferase [Diachasmimorpha longicaudata entomopoxvirus]|uniref:Putative lecithin:cholesterol acyltransferase n=1 Tax=Diachasmimorpha longicaudata entomopoxvirus TaxID=109981 RepID=A0A7R5WFF9_9POXV|nr:putative lecithin:cholesterol acyltransferase [Diachasmimorpha longicaudata entomopoxvirus]AKS26455.1 putative lecithin:cholesterol acyltransferase [Diachasmimorpha longicaudata entomopoxvirus]